MSQFSQGQASSSLQEVKNAVEVLYSPNTNPDVRKKADQFLTNCVMAPWGWELGGHLLSDTNGTETSSFYGAHIICQKCSKKADLDGLNHQLRAQLVNLLYNVLGQSSTTTQVEKRIAQALANFSVGDATGYGMTQVLLNNVQFQQLPLSKSLEILKLVAIELSVAEEKDYVRAEPDDVRTVWSCVMKALALFSNMGQTDTDLVPLRVTPDDINNVQLRCRMFRCAASWSAYGTTLSYMTSITSSNASSASFSLTSSSSSSSSTTSLATTNTMLTFLLRSVLDQHTFRDASLLLIEIIRATDMQGDLVEDSVAFDLLSCIGNLTPALLSATQTGGEDEFCALLSHLSADILLVAMDYLAHSDGRGMNPITSRAVALSLQCTAHPLLMVSEYHIEVWERVSELPSQMRPEPLRNKLFSQVFQAVVQRSTYKGSSSSSQQQQQAATPLQRVLEHEDEMEKEAFLTYRRHHAPHLMELCFKECRATMEAFLQSELSNCVAPHRVEVALYLLSSIGQVVRDEFANATNAQQRNIVDQQIGQYFTWICHLGASNCPCWSTAAMKALTIFIPWVQLEEARVEAAVKYTIALVRNAGAGKINTVTATGQENNDSTRAARVIDQAITGFSKLCSRCARALATPSALKWMLSSLDPVSVMTLSPSSRVRLTEALCGVIARSESTDVARQCVETVLSVTMQSLSSHASNSFAEDGRMNVDSIDQVAADFRVVSAALTRMQYVKPKATGGASATSSGSKQEERRLVATMTDSVWPLLVHVGTCVGNVVDSTVCATVASTDLLPSLCQLSSVIVRTNGGQIDQYFTSNNILLLLNMMGKMFVTYRHPKTLQPLGIVVSFFGSQPQWFEPLLNSLASIIGSVNSGGGSSNNNYDPELLSATMTLIQQYTARCPATLKHVQALELVFVFSIRALSSSQVEVSTSAVRFFASLAHTSRRLCLLQSSINGTGRVGEAALFSCVVAHGKSFLFSLLHGIGHQLPLDSVRRVVDTLALWNVPFRQHFVAWANQIISDEQFVGATKLNLKGRNSFVLGLSTLQDSWSGGGGENVGHIDRLVMEEYRQLVFTFAAQCRGESLETVENS